MSDNKQYILHKKIRTYAEDKKLIIFGTGNAALRTVINLGVLFSRVSYFVDNKNIKENEKFYDKKVFSAEILKEESKEDVFILVASSFYKDIFTQLIQYGFKEKENFIETVYFTKEIDASTLTNRVVNGVKVGKFTYGYERHCFNGTLLKEIGAFCSINESVKIGEVNHPTNLVTTHPILYTPKDEILGYEGVPGIINKEQTLDVFQNEYNEGIHIGNDVWIGANAVVLPGVTIHDGAIIGAGAIVTKDIPAYAVVVGVPARVLKYRFNQDQINILEKVQWWNWEADEIINNFDLLKKPELFFEKYKLE